MGHVARRATLVRLREMDEVGRLLLAAGDIGDGLQVSLLHWTSSRPKFPPPSGTRAGPNMARELKATRFRA